MSSYSLSLCAWAYNEEGLIEWFVEKADKDLRAICNDYEIIIVDDCSTDGTWAKLEQMKEKYPSLVITRHDENKDVGYGYRSTTPLATKDVVFYNTIDMIFDTSDIPLFVDQLDGYDLLQGVRTDLSANSPMRKLTTIVNYYFIRFLFGIHMSEFQNTKFVKRELLKKIEFESSSIFTNPEIAIKAYYLGARIKEVEMKYHKRQQGKQKGARLRSLWITFRDIIRFWFKWVICKKIEKKSALQPIDRVSKRKWG